MNRQRRSISSPTIKGCPPCGSELRKIGQGAVIDFPPNLAPNEVLSCLVAEQYLPRDARFVSVLPGEGP
jgi:hypothetical protein